MNHLTCLLRLGVAAFFAASPAATPSVALAQDRETDRSGFLKPKRVTLATYPEFSPDNSKILFGWAGDIWSANANGGRARRITTHRGNELRPVFSPDGNQIAFIRELNGQPQVFVMNARGGIPKQVTFHSNGSRLIQWYPDGKSILISGARDFGTRSATRFYRVNLTERKAESLLFDAETAGEASLSPDGTQLLFTREGYDLYRKGYRGSKSSQIWMAENLESENVTFTQLIARETAARSPLWKPDGKGFYFTGNHGKNAMSNVWEFDLATKKESQITNFPDDAAITPSLSKDGRFLVFRKGFEFSKVDLKAEKPASKTIRITAANDSLPDSAVRRVLTKATNLSFSSDGLEMAFTAGGDVWVMDTVLKKPKQVTKTEIEEREPVFAPDNSGIYFIRESRGDMDIFKAEAADSQKYLWQNDEFKLKAITTSQSPKNDLTIVPTGKRIAFVEGQGNLTTADLDGKNPKVHVKSWNQPRYSFSPDGKWVTYSVSDSDFNSDVWIKPLDDHRKPFNLSRHPDNDISPKWSPDGKMIAFTGRRFETETDIYYVHLTRESEEIDKRKKTLDSAIEKMKKERKKPVATPAKPEKKKPEEPEKKTDAPKKETPKADPASEKKPAPKAKADPAKKPEPPANPAPKPNPKAAPKAEPKANEKPAPEKEAPEAAKKPEAPKNEVKIDFENLYERIRRITIKNSAESNLFWAHDSKRLAFNSEVKGVKGTYFVTFPDKLTPSLLNSKTGGLARWDAKNDTIYWLVSGVPSTLSKGKMTSYGFRVNQEYDIREYRRAAFHQIWRVMRDSWYDENLNNKDWDAIRKKYENAAALAIGSIEFQRVVAMTLGELNGSHLGFRASGSTLGPVYSAGTSGWPDTTPNLGLKFDQKHKGPGLKIAMVIPGSNADRKALNLKPGDIISKINGEPVTPGIDLTSILNAPPNEEISLTLAPDDEDKKPRELVISPTSWSQAASLLQRERHRKNREMVDKLSEGKLGYIHVSRMQWNEFMKFEEEIYARGAGKEGLIIDVRDNGGGFTADHLLTVLTPARHAITVPRGGGAGYPQDRLVYATWTKPITVLCNQNSFSNAEIFSHAVKQLKRGQLVGVETAGGVISTGSTSIMDVGSLRLPFRGWYKLDDGQDMELNGAVPDHIVWPEPGDAAKGKDRQIEKAVEVLLKEINDQPKPEHLPNLTPASER